MDTISSYPFSNSILWKEQKSSVSEQSEENINQAKTRHWSLVPLAATASLYICTWPNIHTLFTLATIVSSAACLIFPNPISIGINIMTRCASTGFAAYALDKAKISTNVVNIVAILIIKNWAVGSIALDLIYEGINLNRCEVLREFLKSKFIYFFPKPKKQPLDISRFVNTKFKRDPTLPEDACKILGVPIEEINNLEFIEMRYNSRNREILQKRKIYFDSLGSPFAPEIQRQIDYRDSAYKTLKERKKANSR